MADPSPVIMAYADRLSVKAGAEIGFKVSCAHAPTYRADVVRLRSPEVGPGPDAPEFREEELETPVTGEHPASWQGIYPGSYIRIPDGPSLASLEEVTVCANVYPTLPEAGRQTILSLPGMAVLVEGVHLKVLLGHESEVEVLDSGLVLNQERWTFVAVGVDLAGSRVRFELSRADSHMMELKERNHVERRIEGHVQIGDGPIVIGAQLETDADGRERPVTCFNGKIERPRLFSRVLEADETVPLAALGPELDAAGALADWDFSLGIDSEAIRDVTGNGFDGVAINLPTRGVGGSNWSGDGFDWRERSDEYGAIHFHEDDLLDAGWSTTLSMQIPADWESGCYAGRFRADDSEFYVPFMVRPSDERDRAKVAFLVPTTTYAAYANLRLRVTGQWNELIHGRLTVLDDTDLLMLDYPEIGLSTYDTHSDGSTVVFSSMRRPVTNFRPKGRIYKFCQDLLIVGWLEHEDVPFDVITDEDLDREGTEALSSYRVVVTSSHPEYVSTRTLDVLEGFTRRGGRLMYLGGNGFYHRAAYHPTIGGLVEVRRPDAPRLWRADVTQGHHTFTGEPAGTWTGLGRAPQLLAGVGFITQGFDECSYYRRTLASSDPRAQFIFEGVEDEIIGDFGILQGGAAGYEIDRADHDLGTPSHALIVASSENHSNLFDLMVTSLEDELPVSHPGDPDRIRADMVFFETPGGGAVFSVGSIAWSGSLSHAGYNNNVAQVSRNVLKRFLDPEPLEVPSDVD